MTDPDDNVDVLERAGRALFDIRQTQWSSWEKDGGRYA